MHCASLHHPSFEEMIFPLVHYDLDNILDKNSPFLLYIYDPDGRAELGIKGLFLSWCTKVKFYANLALLYKLKTKFYAKPALL